MTPVLSVPPGLGRLLPPLAPPPVELPVGLFNSPPELVLFGPGAPPITFLCARGLDFFSTTEVFLVPSSPVGLRLGLRDFFSLVASPAADRTGDPWLLLVPPSLALDDFLVVPGLVVFLVVSSCPLLAELLGNFFPSLVFGVPFGVTPGLLRGPTPLLPPTFLGTRGEVEFGRDGSDRELALDADLLLDMFSTGDVGGHTA